MLTGMIVAFSMYSILPMPRVEWSRDNMRYALVFFPLVGLVCGGAVFGWLWLSARLALQPALRGAVAAALPVVLSGGIHLDGFCDTVDALASHAPTPRKLEILKDPHAGAFAVIGCMLYLLLCFGLWAQYSFRAKTAGVLALGYVFSRALSGFSVTALRGARADGLAASFARAADTRRIPVVLLCEAALAAAGMLLCAPVAGAAAIAAGVGVFCYYRWSAYHHFGGITGDLAGYFLQLCELGLLAAVICTGGIEI